MQTDELANEIRAVVYDNILSGLAKAQDARGIAGFQFARKIDGELWGKINAIVEDAELYKKSLERERMLV